MSPMWRPLSAASRIPRSSGRRHLFRNIAKKGKPNGALWAATNRECGARGWGGRGGGPSIRLQSRRKTDAYANPIALLQKKVDVRGWVVCACLRGDQGNPMVECDYLPADVDVWRFRYYQSVGDENSLARRTMAANEATSQPLNCRDSGRKAHLLLLDGVASISLVRSG